MSDIVVLFAELPFHSSELPEVMDDELDTTNMRILAAHLFANLPSRATQLPVSGITMDNASGFKAAMGRLATQLNLEVR